MTDQRSLAAKMNDMELADAIDGMLLDILGEQEKVEVWWRVPNPMFGELTPAQMGRTGRMYYVYSTVRGLAAGPIKPGDLLCLQTALKFMRDGCKRIQVTVLTPAMQELFRAHGANKPIVYRPEYTKAEWDYLFRLAEADMALQMGDSNALSQWP